MQLQAAYMLESVRNALSAYAKEQEGTHEVEGLLRSLSTFEVRTDVNLEQPVSPNPALAVAINIITRGLPSLASVNLETYFAVALGLTKRADNVEKGKVAFPFTGLEGDVARGESVFRSLHIIDPRARDRYHYLHVNDTDSGFERSFLQR
jgi:hypothetical protein